MSSLHTRCGTIPMSSAFIVSMEKRISTGAMSLRALARSRRRTLIAMKAPEIDWAKTRTSASMLAEPNSALVIPAASMLPSIAGADRPSLRATSQPATPMSSVSATASTATPSARKPMWRCCVDCTVPRPSYPSQRACHPVLIVFRFGIPAVRRTGRRQELGGCRPGKPRGRGGAHAAQRGQHANRSARRHSNRSPTTGCESVPSNRSPVTTA